MDRCASVEREQQIKGVASYDRIRLAPAGCPAHAFGHSSNEPLIGGVRGLQLQGLPKSSQPLEDRVWSASAGWTASPSRGPSTPTTRSARRSSAEGTTLCPAVDATRPSRFLSGDLRLWPSEHLHQQTVDQAQPCRRLIPSARSVVGLRPLDELIECRLALLVPAWQPRPPSSTRRVAHYLPVS
jgi:hypothetical protein